MVKTYCTSNSTTWRDIPGKSGALSNVILSFMIEATSNKLFWTMNVVSKPYAKVDILTINLASVVRCLREVMSVKRAVED